MGRQPTPEPSPAIRTISSAATQTICYLFSKFLLFHTLTTWGQRSFRFVILLALTFDIGVFKIGWWLLFYYVITMARTDEEEKNCPNGFQKILEKTHNRSYCIAVFNKPENWNNANRICNHFYSFLVHLEDATLDYEFIRIFLKDKADKMHVGVRRRNGIYIWTGPHPQVFRESDFEDVWGHRWSDSLEPEEDCVAFHVNTGKLVTVQCSREKLKFACITEERAETALLCDEDWKFSVLSDNCFKHLTFQNFTEANNSCNRYGGQLISEKTFDSMLPALKFYNITNYVWINGKKSMGTGDCHWRIRAKIVNATRPAYRCDNTMNHVICEKKKKEISIKPYISSKTSQSYERFSGVKLLCEVKVNGETVPLYRSPSIWLNSQPIIISDDRNSPRQDQDSFKQGFDENKNLRQRNKQGVYHCEMLVPGLPYFVYSPPIEIFFNDVSSFVLSLKGVSIPYDPIDHDFSKFSFEKEFMPQIQNKMVMLFEDFESTLRNLSTPKWSFVNASKQENQTLTVVELLLSINYINKSRPSSERKLVFEPLQAYIEDKVTSGIFDDWKITTLNLRNIGICYEKVTHLTSNKTLTWKDSYHSNRIVSTPPCLSKDNKLLVRECKGESFTEASRWDDFNHQNCAFNEEAEPNYPGCNPDYEGWEYDTCIQIHRDERNWTSAIKTCNLNKGYLFSPSLTFNSSLNFNSSFEKFEMGEMWIGAQRKNNIFQWLSFYAGAVYTDLKVSWGLNQPKLQFNCLSGVVSKGEITLYSRDCEEDKPFICMHKKVNEDLLSQFKCLQKWKYSASYDKCYTVTNDVFTRHQAAEHCLRKGGFLTTIPKPENLAESYIRASNSKHRFWWTGLTFVTETSSNESLGVPNQNKSYVALKLMPDSSIIWKIDSKNSEFAAICEKQVNNTEPNKRERPQIYVRKDSTGEIYQCETGSKYYENIIWYKDGSPVYGTRGLIEYVSDIFNPKDLLGSKSASPLEHKWELQGYYWCEVDRGESFVSAASNKVLYFMDEIWTFVAQFVATKVTEQWDLSGDIYLKKRKEFGTKITSDLISCQTFSPNCSVFVDEMFLTDVGLRIKFYIYAEHPIRSKRSLESLQMKQSYMTKLINNINQYVTKAGKSDEFGILPQSAKIKTTDGCLPEKTDLDGMILRWPKANPDQTVLPSYEKGPCVTENGQPVVRRCLGNFTHGNYWSPIVGRCIGEPTNLTRTLKKLSEEPLDKTNAVNVTEKLKSLTKNPSDLQGIDVHYIASVIENVANTGYSNGEILEDIVSTVDYVLEVTADTLTVAQTKVNSSNRITDSLEKILQQTPGYQHISKHNIGVYSYPLNDPNSLVFGIKSLSKGTDDNNRRIVKLEPITNLTSEEDVLGDTKAGIILPDRLLHERISNTSVVNYMIYESDSLFSNGLGRTVFSSIVHAFISGGPVRLKNSSIKIFFGVSQPERKRTSKERCVFWDQSLNYSNGDWSTEGCELTNVTNGFMCNCNHLTNFAVLVSIDAKKTDGTHEVVLIIITYTGCTLSVFGLLLTIISALKFRKLKKTHGSRVLCNLSFSLLATLIVFMAGINQTSSKPVCMLVAALLHYLLLVSFSWMLVEAVLQYLRFVKVIGTYIPRFMLKASICAWGIPLAITAAILAIDYKLYHGGMNYCWLQRKAFYYGFLLPVGLIILTNIIIFCIIIYSIYRKAPGINTPKRDEKELSITRVRALFCILFLLGLSWVFGFFAIDSAKLVFQYLFCIFTTLQGFFIFIFFVVLEHTTRDLWYDYLCQKRRRIQIYFTQDTVDFANNITTRKYS